MAIVKFINERTMTLKEALRYVAATDRVLDKSDGEIMFMGGIADTPDEAHIRMMTIKELWRKTGGREYIHFMISPQKGNRKDMAKFSEQIYNHFRNFSCFYGVHQNTQHIHAHYILNSVGFDGKKISQSKSDMVIFKNEVEKIWKGIVSDEPIKFKPIPSKNLWLKEENIFEEDKSHGYVDKSYVPNINDGHIPQIYRKVDGVYYPVQPYLQNGKLPMIMEVNPETDILPMIAIVDDNGNLKPGI